MRLSASSPGLVEQQPAMALLFRSGMSLVDDEIPNTTAVQTVLTLPIFSVHIPKPRIVIDPGNHVSYVIFKSFGGA